MVGFRPPQQGVVDKFTEPTLPAGGGAARSGTLDDFEQSILQSLDRTAWLRRVSLQQLARSRMTLERLDTCRPLAWAPGGAITATPVDARAPGAEAGVRRSQTDAPAPEAFERLSDRQKEIVRCVAQGKRNKEIARLLVIAPATVKAHLRLIMSKLDVKTRTQLGALVHEVDRNRPYDGVPLVLSQP